MQSLVKMPLTKESSMRASAVMKDPDERRHARPPRLLSAPIPVLYTAPHVRKECLSENTIRYKFCSAQSLPDKALDMRVSSNH